MSKIIPLTQGAHAIVDDDMYDYLMQWKWCLNVGMGGKRYAQRRPGITMHRVIMQAPGGVEVDHVDGDGLNNQRCNMRLVTRQQNTWNQKPRHGSIYKGISFDKNARKWRAFIRIEKKNKHLGCFTSDLDAARAYDQAAREHFGAFAWLNFPEEH